MSMYICVFVFMCGYVDQRASVIQTWGIGFFWAGVTDGCELPCISPGNFSTSSARVASVWTANLYLQPQKL